MGFLERKMQDAEDQAGRLIEGYRQLLNDSDETAAIKGMVASGAPDDTVGKRAADAHRALFKRALESADVKQVSKSKTRSAIVEQFCVALWRKHLGEGGGGYQAMVQELGLAKA